MDWKYEVQWFTTVLRANSFIPYCTEEIAWQLGKKIGLLTHHFQSGNNTQSFMDVNDEINRILTELEKNTPSIARNANWLENHLYYTIEDVVAGNMQIKKAGKEWTKEVEIENLAEQLKQGTLKEQLATCVRSFGPNIPVSIGDMANVLDVSYGTMGVMENNCKFNKDNDRPTDIEKVGQGKDRRYIWNGDTKY